MAESSSGGTTPQPTPLPGEAPASSTLADIPVFVVQPSWNDFKDFRSFITKLEHSVTGRTAIVKVQVNYVFIMLPFAIFWKYTLFTYQH